MKERKDLEKLYKQSIDQVKDDIRKAVKKDVLIIQAVNSIRDLDKAIDLLFKRLSDVTIDHLADHVFNPVRALFLRYFLNQGLNFLIGCRIPF